MKNKNDDEPAANAELEVDADRRSFWRLAAGLQLSRLPL